MMNTRIMFTEIVLGEKKSDDLKKIIDKICIIYTTCSSENEAKKLAEGAVKKKLAACVNIIPNSFSIYESEGEIKKEQEYLLLFKTDHNRMINLSIWLQKNHPYSIPAILRGEAETSYEFHRYVKNQGQ